MPTFHPPPQADLAPKHAARIFNTWVGEPSKLVLLEAMLKTIRRDQVGEEGLSLLAVGASDEGGG